MIPLSLRHLIEKAASLQFSRYLLVGGGAWVLDFAVFASCHTLVGVVWAQTLARVTGAVAAFTGHKLFVYKNKANTPRALGRQAAGYLLLWLLSYLLSIGLVVLFIEVMGLHPIAAKLAMEIILVGINYLTMKQLIFPS
jgi:putative flippase GtrA